MSLVIGSVLLLACAKKDEEPACDEVTPVNQPGMTVVTPSPYLPAYPGSWWEYSDGSRVITGESYSLEPVLSTDLDQNGVSRCCSGRKLWMPTYDGCPLYGYVRMDPSADGDESFCNKQLLSEQLGDLYWWGGDHYGRTRLKTMAIDTTIVLTDGSSYSPCIMVKMVGGIAANYFDQAQYYQLFLYARNVGLVKHVKVHPTVITRELTSYHIGD